MTVVVVMSMVEVVKIGGSGGGDGNKRVGGSCGGFIIW